MKQSFIISLLVLLYFTGNTQGGWKDDIGFTRLKSELGDATPTGAGVGVSQAEAGTSSYMPDTSGSQFIGKTFTNASALGVGTSGHATGVASTFFGDTASISPGVRSIRSYQASDWLNVQLGYVLGLEPVRHLFSDAEGKIPLKVQNHSWVGGATTSDAGISEATSLSQRVDFLVNRDDLLIVGGTDNVRYYENNDPRPLPSLLAPSYNSLIVGRSNSDHVSGMTSFYGSDRYLPHLVAPGGTTSTATPMVSSTAAMLYEVAAKTNNADHVEVMRAVLMAGATKQKFASWDRTATRPIDEHFGAGEVNAYNSYHMIAAGELSGSSETPTLVGEYGYDFVATDNLPDFFASTPMQYQFDVDSGFCMDELSIFLSWNINVQNTAEADDALTTLVDLTPGTGDLANLDIKLFDASNALIDQSISTLYNFEHIYMTDLAAGSYRLEVSGDQPVDYGLAWRYSVVAVPEPTHAIAIAAILGGFISRRRRSCTRV